MFNKASKWFLEVFASGATAGATGGASTVVNFVAGVIRHLPEIILTSALIVILGMYGCEKRKVTKLTADKTKLEETVKAKDIEIAKQAEEIAFQKDLVAKRTAELGITKAALDKQGAVEAQTEELKKEKDAILDKWAAEQDPKKRAEYEAAYWNKVLGIKTEIDKKTNEVKLLGPIRPIKPVKPIGGGR